MAEQQGSGSERAAEHDRSRSPHSARQNTKTGRFRQTMPRVSVIIPAYNAERYIGATLASVREQDFGDYEVIVVDDGSTDETRAIVNSVEGVVLVSQPNSGPAAARQRGLSLARGQYIAFLDADDVWDPHMLDACVNLLDGRPDIGAVHTNWRYIDSEGRPLARANNWRPLRGDIFDHLLAEITLITPGIAWRREWWDWAGGFDQTPEINDDWLNWLRLSRLGCRFDFIDQPLVSCRRHEESLTRTQSERVVQWRMRALDRICHEFAVPEPLRARAYAQAYWIATLTALRRHDLDAAARYFLDTVRLDASFLERDSTYFAIALPDDLDVRITTIRLRDGESNLHYLLLRLAGSEEVPEPVASRANEFLSNVYLCLARAAHSEATVPGGIARQLLSQAFRADPATLLESSNLLWVARLLVGRRATLRLHRWLKPARS
jgi:glycosyltransferase involved in cell wall biosynthesis